MTDIGSRPRAMLLALHILAMGALAAPVPALAMQILDAADHAELAAEISASGVNRIALMATGSPRWSARRTASRSSTIPARATSICAPRRQPLPAARRTIPSPCSSAPRRVSPTG